MSIKISKFGKIRKADIALDGLTVIAGQNDTGKSTIGKALFSVIKSVIDFPQLYYELSQKKAFSKLSAILFEILKNDSKKSKALLDIRNEILNSIFDEKQQDVYKNIYSYLEQLSLYMDEAQVDDNIKEQIVNINKDLVKDIDNDEKFKEIAEYIFSKDFKRDYNNSVSKEQSKIDYSIGDSLVASLSFEKNRIELAHIDVDYKAKSFSDVTFIESPLYLEESHNSKSPYVEDLKDKISISKDLLDEKNNNVEILEQIDLVLGQGKFEYDKEKKQLKYKVSENASPLNIENIASGSKMFGLIYLLHVSRKINLLWSINKGFTEYIIAHTFATEGFRGWRGKDWAGMLFSFYMLNFAGMDDKECKDGNNNENTCRLFQSGGCDTGGGHAPCRFSGCPSGRR